MRTCGRCKKSLPLTKFRWKNKEKTLYQGYCIECNKAKNKEHYQENKQAYKDKARAYEALHGGRQALSHHISADCLREMYAKYDGMCWSCRERPATAIDHDHRCCPGTTSCGRCVRGLLCHWCNAGIGLLGDTSGGVEKAVQYLTEYSSGATIDLAV
jgi:Fe-S cluster biogenesis protein NfuA